MVQQRASAGVFLENPDTGRFLFHLRDDIPTIADPGMWSVIGGGVEEGETPEQAAIRETREEIGIELERVVPLTTLEMDVQVGSRSETVAVHLFYAMIGSRVDEIELTEGQKVEYLTLEEYCALENAKPEFVDLIEQELLALRA